MVRALLCLWLLPLYIAGATAAAPPIVIRDAWARATPPDAAVGVVYLTLQAAMDDDELQGGTTPIAANVEMHESRMADGMMEMRSLPKLGLLRGQTVVFEPAGKHIMLVGLRSALREGSTFPLTLKFARAGDVTIQIRVIKEP